MFEVLPTRRVWLAVQIATNVVPGVLVGGVVVLLVVVQGGPWILAALFPAMLGGTLGVQASTSIRRRCLVVTDDGITAVRNGYQLRARWDELESFGPGRFLGMPIVVLHLSSSTIDPPELGGRVAEQLARAVRAKGADRRMQVSMYVRDIARGSFGDALREHRPDLV